MLKYTFFCPEKVRCDVKSSFLKSNFSQFFFFFCLMVPPAGSLQKLHIKNAVHVYIPGFTVNKNFNPMTTIHNKVYTSQFLLI